MNHKSPSPNTSTFTVLGMTCGHCVSSVTEEVQEVADVEGVDVDLESGALTLTTAGPVDPVALRAAVTAAVDEAGYQLA
jgi:copper chaperone CopZ